ncbi:MAG: phosphatidate cytidylyltransferase [Oscillospiraceae bacterium]|nr:phosphatidate cytidylyltransferase [Oscillospiraceae bacterium]
MLEFIKGALIIAAYIIPLAAIMLTLRKFIKIPDELFRKILHFIFLGAYIPFLFAFQTWWKSALLALLLILPLYPILKFAERIPAFSSFVTERKKGEFKNSMFLALGMMFVCICICWGILNDRFLALASVYAWGVGDAFAALIGKRFGKHKIKLKFADCHKSVEGSSAMFVSSTIAALAVLLVRGGLGVFECVFIAAIAAAVCTFVELCSKNGFDTVTCPAAAMIVILPLCRIFGG